MPKAISNNCCGATPFRDVISNGYLRITFLVLGILAIVLAHYFAPTIVREITIAAGSLLIATSFFASFVDTSQEKAQKQEIADKKAAEKLQYNIEDVGGFSIRSSDNCFCTFGSSPYRDEDEFKRQLAKPNLSRDYNLYTAIAASESRANFVDEDGNTLLHHFARLGLDIEFLLSRGLDIDAKNIKGDTPLHVAAAHRKAKVVEALLDKGCEVNVKNNDLATPLLQLISTRPSVKKYEEMAPLEKAVLENDINIEILLRNKGAAIPGETITKFENDKAHKVHLIRVHNMFVATNIC